MNWSGFANEFTVGVLSTWKCASLTLSPWLPWGFDKPNRRSFRKSLYSSQIPLRGTRPTTFKPRLDLLFTIPERKGNVLYTVCIRYTCNSIFTPAESSRSCVVVGEIAPGVAICTVILSDYTMTNPALACCFSIRYDLPALTCGPLSLRLYQSTSF